MPRHIMSFFPIKYFIHNNVSSSPMTTTAELNKQSNRFSNLFFNPWAYKIWNLIVRKSKDNLCWKKTKRKTEQAIKNKKKKSFHKGQSRRNEFNSPHCCIPTCSTDVQSKHLLCGCAHEYHKFFDNAKGKHQSGCLMICLMRLMLECEATDGN
jgi:phenylalanyl-tRNA synthetase alpha subunit